MLEHADEQPNSEQPAASSDQQPKTHVEWISFQNDLGFLSYRLLELGATSAHDTACAYPVD